LGRYAALPWRSCYCRPKPGAPSPKSDYERFVEDFLKFISRERETLGEEQFAQRFPLEGFEDWMRRRKPVK
jgi:hypothetical protein